MTPNINKAKETGDSASESAESSVLFDRTTTGEETKKMAANGLAALEQIDPIKEPEIFEDAVSQTQKRQSPLPIFCLKQGLDSKQSALKVDSWIALALTLDGRDKITKVLQYLARFLTWWLAGNRSAERFKALKESLTTCRKAFRLGRSFIEFRKIQELQVPRAIGVSLRQSVEPSDELNQSDDGTSKQILKETTVSMGKIYSMLYDKVYRPLVLRMCSLLLSVNDDKSVASLSSPLWKTIGTATKMMGLLGFWAGDNISFLASSGFLDDLRNNDKNARLTRRNETSTAFSKFANRSYFLGALAGLYVNLKVYLEHRAKKLSSLQEKVDQEEGECKAKALKELEAAKEKEFSLAVALIKSCCDVLVFSNNPGIDLWMKLKGKKLNEGIHCAGGLISASTVLYNNFPNKQK